MSIQNSEKDNNFFIDDSIKKEPAYITLGEFAKLSNLNRTALNFYCKKGIIKPAYIGENKYKYFLPEQIQIINCIKYLRKCDMPIENIKDIINNPTYETMKSAFSMQQDYLSKKIQQLEKATVFLDRLKKMLDYIESKEINVPFIDHFEAEELYLTPVRYCHSLNYITNAELISDFLEFEEDSFPEHLMCCMIPYDIIHRNDFCSYMHDSIDEYSENRSGKINAVLLSRPESDYACIINEGGSGTIKDAVNILLDYVAEKNIGVSGNAYIINSAGYINLTNSASSKYLIQLQVNSIQHNCKPEKSTI